MNYYSSFLYYSSISCVCKVSTYMQSFYLICYVKDFIYMQSVPKLWLQSLHFYAKSLPNFFESLFMYSNYLPKFFAVKSLLLTKVYINFTYHLYIFTIVNITTNLESLHHLQILLILQIFYQSQVVFYLFKPHFIIS